MISVNRDEPFWLSTTDCDSSVSQNRMDLLVRPPSFVGTPGSVRRASIAFLANEYPLVVAPGTSFELNVYSACASKLVLPRSSDPCYDAISRSGSQFFLRLQRSSLRCNHSLALQSQSPDTNKERACRWLPYTGCQESED